MNKLFQRYTELNAKLQEKDTQIAEASTTLAEALAELAAAQALVRDAEFTLSDLTASREWYENHLKVTADQIRKEMK
jgi:chromosome segregation ATPase